ncbi:hypothetical protein OUHCRE6_49020 [Enterobacter hormaechei subsp. steigerwaltii]
MELLKDYLRAKEYCNKNVWVYTYNKHGEKVLLFGNKGKILNYTLGFTFLDCEVVNIELSYLNGDNLNKCDEIDITINYR